MGLLSAATVEEILQTNPNQIDIASDSQLIASEPITEDVVSEALASELVIEPIATTPEISEVLSSPESAELITVPPQSPQLPAAEQSVTAKNLTSSTYELKPRAELFPKSQPKHRSERPIASPVPSPVTAQVNAAWQALFSELSTMWLLFLGVFLVVVSSGLLAASQWRNFAPVGQYLLLFAYSAGFFGVSFWTSRDQRLRLTSRALQLVTLLLIPINFWAMDGLGLLGTSTGILMALGCGGILSLIAAFLWQTSLTYITPQIMPQNFTPKTTNSPTPQIPRNALHQLTTITIPLLSWLHLGWGMGGYGLLAMYLGTILVAVTVLIHRRQRLNTADISTFPLAMVATTYGGLLLVGRALIFAKISMADLGLSLGIFGWVMVQGRYVGANSPQVASDGAIPDSGGKMPFKMQFNLGQVLLGVGWLLGLAASTPWQSLGVGLLVLGLLWEELQQKLQPITLNYLFFWGLHLLWLVQRVIPEPWQVNSRQQLMAFFQIDQLFPLFGVGLFPYVIGTLLIGTLCHRTPSKTKQIANQKAQAITAINRTGEKLALFLGVVLTGMSMFSPATLCLNLTLSGLTLFVIQAQRPATNYDPQTRFLPEWVQLIYGTHIVLLGAVGSGVFLLLRLSGRVVTAGNWLILFVVMALLEWGVIAAVSYGLRNREHPSHLKIKEWIDSAWVMGIILSVISYRLFSVSFSKIGTNEALIWLGIPIAAMGLGYLKTSAQNLHQNYYSYFRRQRWATKISVIFILLAQFEFWRLDQTQTALMLPPVIWSLSIGWGVMWLNTRQIRHGINSWLTIGFGFVWSQIMVFWFNQGSQNPMPNIVVAVIFILGLQVLHHRWLVQDQRLLAASATSPASQSFTKGNDQRHYRRSADLWTGLISLMAVISHFSLIALSFTADAAQRNSVNSYLIDCTLAIAVITGGLIYRTVQQRQAWAEWVIGWGIGLTVAALTVIAGGDFLELAAGQMVLGLASQYAGDWWVRCQSQGQTSLTETPLTNGSGYARSTYAMTWHGLPLVYGLVSLTLSLFMFFRGHGLIVLGVAAIAMGVGRRVRATPNLSDGQFKFLTYTGMAGVTYSLYVLLIQQIFGQPFFPMPTQLDWRTGANLGNILIMFALLPVVLGYGYRLGTKPIQRYLRISRDAVSLWAHCHWVLGLLFLGLAGLFTFSSLGYSIALTVAVALAVYAVSRGLEAEFFPWLSKITSFSAISPPVISGINRVFDRLVALIAIGLLGIATALTIEVFQPRHTDSLSSLTQPLSLGLCFAHILPVTVLVTVGLVYRSCYQGNNPDHNNAPRQSQPQFWQEWGIAWGIELITSGAIIFSHGSAIELAIANLALGFGAQLLGDWWIERTGQTAYPLSWHLIPLVYGGMGSLLRWGMTADFSGLMSLSTALIGIGVGRRSAGVQFIFRLLTYFSMAGATVAFYELLYDQLLDGGANNWFSAGINFQTHRSDGLVVLSILGCGLAYLSQWCQRWLMPYLRLSSHELDISAHLHWLIAVGLVVNASNLPHRLGLTSPLHLSPVGGIIGVVVLIPLAVYAFIQARIPSLTTSPKRFNQAKSNQALPDPEAPIEIKVDLSNCLWVFSGLGLALLAVGYWLWFAARSYELINGLILPYGAALICVVSAVLYGLPWQRWGWFALPWHLGAAALPLVLIALTTEQITSTTLGLVGIFYSIYAYLKRQIRITYITVLLWDWALIGRTQPQDISGFIYLIHNSPLAYALVIGLSGLYLTHVEPMLQQSAHARNLRHLCRMVVVGLLCAIGFVTTLNSVSHALFMWILTSIFVICGLAWRIRAYLIIGTITFVALVLVQAIILVTQYSFLLWVMGIFAGIAFIFVAANFESRRDFIWGLMRHVLDELAQWQ